MMRIVLITSSARWTWMSLRSSSNGSSDGGRSFAAVSLSFGISTTMSGVMPFPWIDRPLGVKYFGRQAQPRAVREADDRLDRALAEGLGADDDRAAPVLERARHD